MNHALRKPQFLPGFNGKTALWAAITISLIFRLIMVVAFIYVKFIYKGINHNVAFIVNAEVIIEFIISTLLLYVIFLMEFWAIKYFWNYPKKIVLAFLGLVIFIFIASVLVSQLLGIWFRGNFSASVYFSYHLVKNLITVVISFIFTALIYFINKNHKNDAENQKLVIENIKNRYNALKNQTNPHFLFNSLNTLNGLIGDDDKRAHEYLDQLSSVFRYTIKDRFVVTLSEEFQFVESYIYLMKIRYVDGLNIQIDVHDEYNNYFILPFGLQILVENAVKHNVISHKHPLNIFISTTDDARLRVVNNLQPRLPVKNFGQPQNVNAESGLGLVNLNERYRLMFNMEIDIHTDNLFFTVEIPLMKNVGKEETLI